MAEAPGSTRWLPLSLRAFVRLKRLQAALGFLFGFFVVVHLGNAAACLFGLQVAEGVLLRVRAVLDLPGVEAAWIGLPVVGHAVIAAVLWRHERALREVGVRARERLGRPAPTRVRRRARSARWHRLTGFSLALLVPAHVAVLRFGVSFGGGEAAEALGGYHRAQALLTGAPLVGTALLALLGAAAGYHLGYGAFMGLVNLGVLGPGRPRRWGRVAGYTLGAAAAAIALAASWSLVAGGQTPNARSASTAAKPIRPGYGRLAFSEAQDARSPPVQAGVSVFRSTGRWVSGSHSVASASPAAGSE